MAPARSWAIGLLAWALAVPALAAEDPLALIERMGEAARELSYHGTFIYRQGGQLETVRIIHRGDGDGGGERERLVSLTGIAREVLRDERNVTCIHSGNRSVIVNRVQRKTPLVRRLGALDPDFASHYELALEGEDRVAGRATRVVDIRPRDAFRYGYRLWLDRESGLLLRYELRDPAGETLEEMVYTSLELPAAIPDEMLEPSLSGEGFSWRRQDLDERPGGPQARGEAFPWEVSWLPEGFELTHEEQGGGPMGPGDSLHRVYSDGLGAMSVYIEAPPLHMDPFDGLSFMGAVHAFGRVVDDHQVTVVGEVPEATVRRVGSSVTRR